MGQSFFHEGRSIDYTNPTGDPIPAGSCVDLQSNMVGCVAVEIPGNALGALQIEGVFKFTNDGNAYALGDEVGINPATATVVNAGTGHRVVAAATATDVVLVKININI